MEVNNSGGRDLRSTFVDTTISCHNGDFLVEVEEIKTTAKQEITLEPDDTVLKRSRLE